MPGNRRQRAFSLRGLGSRKGAVGFARPARGPPRSSDLPDCDSASDRSTARERGVGEGRSTHRRIPRLESSRLSGGFVRNARDSTRRGNSRCRPKSALASSVSRQALGLDSPRSRRSPATTRRQRTTNVWRVGRWRRAGVFRSCRPPSLYWGATSGASAATTKPRSLPNEDASSAMPMTFRRNRFGVRHKPSSTRRAGCITMPSTSLGKPWSSPCVQTHHGIRGTRSTTWTGARSRWAHRRSRGRLSRGARPLRTQADHPARPPHPRTTRRAPGSEGLRDPTDAASRT